MQQQYQLFDAFAKASTVLHLSADESSRALLALEQMFSKGKIQAQELRLQLGQAIPGAAERFQQAVMKMVQGTDLQGKSFDQLLQSGALVTDRFIPALVASFEDAGKGWEDASHSLNSNINRLQSSWFNLKTAVTDGPFSTALNVVIGDTAENLDNLADVVRTSTGPAAAELAKGWTLVELAIRDAGTTAAWMVDQLRIVQGVTDTLQPQRRI
jgi:tape measure domain-containing protein